MMMLAARALEIAPFAFANVVSTAFQRPMLQARSLP